MENPELIFSAMLVATSIAIVLYAGLQHRLEEKNTQIAELARQNNIDISLWEKRVRVYDAILEVLRYASINGKMELDIIGTMLYRTQHAKFLFKKDDKITDYIEEFLKKGSEWKYKEYQLRTIKNPTKRQPIANKQTDIIKWFTSEYQNLDQKFEKYLRIE